MRLWRMRYSNNFYKYSLGGMRLMVYIILRMCLRQNTPRLHKITFNMCLRENAPFG